MLLSLFAVAICFGGALTAPTKRQSHTIPSTYDPTVAQTIYNVGTQLGVSASVMQAGFEAAWVESHCNNLNFGDSDSVGVFQQRPSQGWGTVAQLEDPTYAATAFFNAATKVYNNNPDLTPGQIAQGTQHSAYPDRYDQAAQKATNIQNDVKNNDPDGDEDDDLDDDDTLVDDLDDDGENDYDYDGEDGDEFGPGDDDLGEDDGYDAGDGDGDGGDGGGDDGGGDDGGGDDGGGDDGGGDDGGEDGCRRKRGDKRGELCARQEAPGY